jgi:hypothetical protein
MHSTRRGGRRRLLRPLALVAVVGARPVLIGMAEVRPEQALARPTGLRVALAIAVLGLVWWSRCCATRAGDARWNAKPVCLGLGRSSRSTCSSARRRAVRALRRRRDQRALLVHAAAVPLLYVASRRHADWLGKLHVSRAAVFHSATLLLVGAYLLFVAGVGYYVRYTGGDWGGRCRWRWSSWRWWRWRCWWRRARCVRGCASTSARTFQLPLRLPRGVAALHAAAVRQRRASAHGRDRRAGAGQPGGEPERHAVDAARAGGDFVQAARWNLPAQSGASRDGRCALLQERAWIIDLDEWRAPQATRPGCRPGWWTSRAAGCWCRCWREALIGFVLGCRRARWS